ncbi:MAG: class I SAM-dependent methyltransferase [Promethearchaeota archaeon]
MESNLDFRIMCLTFKIRDFFKPRSKIVVEAGIERGFNVVDYGCGCGSYVLPVARLIGKEGRLYAVDKNPLAIQRVKKIISRYGLESVETIQADCKTGITPGSIDIVLLHDVFHELDDPASVLNEIHGLLKPSTGKIQFSDHHMKHPEILRAITGTGLFKLKQKKKFSYIFLKAN